MSREAELYIVRTGEEGEKKKERASARARSARAEARPTLPPDAYAMLTTVVVLVFFGLLMMYSASYVQGVYQAGDAHYYIVKQLLCLAIGLAAAVVAYGVSRHLDLFKLAVPAVALAALLVVLVRFFGTEAYGARRWIEIGGIRLQPSELAKFAVIVFAARQLTILEYRGAIDDLVEVARALWPVAFVAVLVVLQPDMTTGFLILCGALLAFYYSKAGIGTLLKLSLPLAPLVAVAAVLIDYRQSRLYSFVASFLDPLKGSYQVRQSVYGLARGGLFGEGLGRSIEKYLYLPAAHTDFIASIIGEELGLVGLALVVVMFVLFCFTGLRFGLKVASPFARKVILACVSLIGMQAFINLGSAIGLLPVVGVPLPFVSYGGTSLIANLMALGMMVGLAARGGGDEDRLYRRRDRRPRVPSDQRHTRAEDDLELL
jgi:cell division protein FtsW